MTYLAIASTLLKFLLWLMKHISYKEINNAKLSGEELGQLRVLKVFSEVIDGKVANAKLAYDDVVSGRVSVDSTSDPNNRANKPGSGGSGEGL